MKTRAELRRENIKAAEAKTLVTSLRNTLLAGGHSVTELDQYIARMEQIRDDNHEALKELCYPKVGNLPNKSSGHNGRTYPKSTFEGLA